MKARSEYFLRSDELRQAAERDGMQLSPSSPLHAYLHEGTPSQAGYVSEAATAARSALAILAAPTIHVRVMTLGDMQSHVAYFYGVEAGETDLLIGCWPEAEGCRISWPWSVADLADAALVALGGERSNSADQIALELSPAGLFTLAAATDALRAEELSALLQRRRSRAPQLTESDLRDQIAFGMTENDARWTFALLRLAGPEDLTVGPSPFEAGLKELLAAKLIRTDGQEWIAGDTLRHLAQFWATPLPAISHELVLRNPEGSLRARRHSLLFGGVGPLWRLEFELQDTAKPRTSLRSIATADLPHHLISTLGSLRAAVQAPPKGLDAGSDRREMISPPGLSQKAAPKVCAQCGAELGPTWKFCKSCGASAHAST